MRGAWLATLAAAALVLCSCGGSSADDPADAACPHPPVSFGKAIAVGDHREVSVGFTCEGARLRGTIYLPPGSGRHPAVIWLHGSGEQPRLGYGPLVAAYVKDGIAFFTYDKRGVGESQGTCCPGDRSHFNLLAADADGAVNAVRKRAEIDPARIGFLGTSQAGWVVPLAVVRLRGRVAFTAFASGPAVTTHEEQEWSKLAGEDAANPPPLTPEKKAEIARQLKPSGFDPVPRLARMTVPGIWLYGRQDRSQPAEKSAATLERLRRTKGKDFTVVLFPHADHGLLDTPPTDPRPMPTLLAWIQKHVRPT